MKMKRLVAALTIFSLSAIGITFAAGNDLNPVQDFFVGSVDIGSSSLNPQLVLLPGPTGDQGPAGPPGPAGVAGRDGFVGINGQDGEDGLPGAPGEAGLNGRDGTNGRDGVNGAPGAPGAPGAAVVATVVQTGAGQPCSGRGGTKFTDAAGTITYACNGTAGSGGGGSFTATTLPVGDANCVNGGTSFDDGVNPVTYACNGTSVNSNLGMGNVALASCDNDVAIALNNDFNGSSFSIDSIVLSNVSNACGGSKLVAYIAVKSSGSKKGSSTKYNVGLPADVITCNINSVTVTSGTITVSDATATCKVKRTNASITLAEINAEDIGSNIGLTLSS
jgi:hypothetical protein